MTALRKYERLESTGLWRIAPEAQLCEVVVGLRAATLVLSDPKTEMALSQWSLPALLRLNPGESPALYGPGDRFSETLEVQDGEMVAALETVRAAILRRHPRPGRLRGLFVAAGLAVSLAFGVFWLPGHLTDYTASMLPPPTRAALGALALADLARLTGSPCDTRAGRAAAAKLVARLAPAPISRLVLVRDGVTRPLALPGGIIVLPAALLDVTDGPEAVAGYAIAETLRARTPDPTDALLHFTGIWPTIRLLATGAMPPEAVAGYGEALVRGAPLPLSDEAVVAAFTAAGLSTSPYAFALDPSGKSSQRLIEADPYLAGSPRAVLSDEDWLSLQAICTG